MGTKWFIEGDIKGCFDNLDHTILMSSLRARIRGNRFLRLIEEMLKAGDGEGWNPHPWLSGTPQGGVVSPLLAHICLDRLGQFVSNTRIPEYTRGTKRKQPQASMHLIALRRYHRREGHYDRAEALRREAQNGPAIDPTDHDYRRWRSVRYADDFLLGLAGPKAGAAGVKRELAACLGTALDLTRAAEKTLVTHATQERARFLGYEIGIMESRTTFDNRRRRSGNGRVGRYIPEDVIPRQRQKCQQNGKAIHRAELLNDRAFDIICLYQWEYRGLVEYDLMAQNTYRLGVVKRTVETSLLKTLAAKNRTAVQATAQRLADVWHTPNGPRKCLKLTAPRGGKKPVAAVFGGLSRARRRNAPIKEQVITPYINKRSELIERLTNDTCEVCGATGAVEVHHVRKMADLKKKGQKEKPLWVQIMVARQRKALIVCHECQMEIQPHRQRNKA